MNHKLEFLREERKLLRKEVAKEIGVSESVYSEWENNKLAIPTRRIYQLANFYQVNIDYLLGLTNERENIYTKDEINLIEVGNRIREVRKVLKLNMRELAKYLNTTSSAISNYENGKFLILSSFLIYISKQSNYSIDWILGRTDSKKIL